MIHDTLTAATPNLRFQGPRAEPAKPLPHDHVARCATRYSRDAETLAQNITARCRASAKP
jgi:hypothetical protein